MINSWIILVNRPVEWLAEPASRLAALYVLFSSCGAGHLVSGEASVVSESLSDLPIIIGANISRLRRLRHLTAAQLAAASGVAKGTLSQLESGRGNPTTGTLYAISAILGTSLGELLVEQVPTARIVRSDEGPHVPESGADVRLIDRIAVPGFVFEILELSVQPAQSVTSQPHAIGVWEHLILRRGELSAGLVGHLASLRPGDYITFPGDEQHGYEAGRSGAKAILLMRHPIGQSSTTAPERSVRAT